jgi:predicted acyl esterase
VPASAIPDGADVVAFSLQATCATLKVGERLRLSIAGASFPAYPVNPGTGQSPVSTPAVKALITTIGIAHGSQAGSVLEFTTREPLPACAHAFAPIAGNSHEEHR